MPEQEFELYLSLLSRFLRLKSAQRGEISDELRDHLEARLEELAAAGVPREEAVRRALDEFGDAAELARHFTHIAHIRRRRVIMRYTLGTIAAASIAILVATAFWPEPHNAPLPVPNFSPVVAVAQTIGGSAAGFAPGAPAAPVQGESSVEARLEKKIEKLEFDQVPLGDALEFLGEQTEIDILVNSAALADAGIATDSPVMLKVRYTLLSARTALDLVLEQYNLSYTIRDGLIMVTTSDKANEIQVYNCRDLTGEFRTAAAGGMEGMSSMMAGGPGAAGPMGMGSAAMGSMPGMPPGGGMGYGGGGTHSASLAEVIMATIDPPSWSPAGGHGSISEFNGLLVVKNNQTAHGKIKQLLEMMRSVAKPAAAAMPGMMPGAPSGMGTPGARRPGTR